MRKFTKVIKSVFEKEISLALDEESKATEKMLQEKVQVVSSMKAMEDELAEGDTQLTKKMREEKAAFLKKHGVKKAVTDASITKAIMGGAIPNIVSLPVGKREAEDDVSSLEEKVPQKKSKKQRHK